jgi:hypothetical protein
MLTLLRCTQASLWVSWSAFSSSQSSMWPSPALRVCKSAMPPLTRRMGPVRRRRRSDWDRLLGGERRGGRGCREGFVCAGTVYLVLQCIQSFIHPSFRDENGACLCFCLTCVGFAWKGAPSRKSHVLAPLTLSLTAVNHSPVQPPHLQSVRGNTYT